MGESDLYCAFCSGPMSKSRIEFNKRQSSAPRRRAAYSGASTAENEQTDADDHDDEESIASTNSEADNSDSEREGTSGYNIDVLPPEKAEWVCMCRCLALNMDRFETDGVGMAFISGHGSPDGLGYFTVLQRGTGNLTGKDRISSQLTYQIRMMRDYTYLEGAEQCWQCHSGLEYCVADPSPSSSITQIIQASIAGGLLSKKLPAFDFSHQVRSDPLQILPYAVIYNIIEYLDINDTLALRQASWYVFDWTRSDTAIFGKQMVRLHLSPWLWEVDDFVSSIHDPALDLTRLFSWLEAVTEPKFGMSGPFLGVANRWRIWDTCQQLVLDYQDRVGASGE